MPSKMSCSVNFPNCNLICWKSLIHYFWHDNATLYGPQLKIKSTNKIAVKFKLLLHLWEYIKNEYTKHGEFQNEKRSTDFYRSIQHHGKSRRNFLSTRSLLSLLKAQQFKSRQWDENCPSSYRYKQLLFMRSLCNIQSSILLVHKEISMCSILVP